MRLTQQQQSLITGYLRAVAAQFDQSQPQRLRQRALLQVQTRIERDLQALTKDGLEDRDVQKVLDLLGSPAHLASNLMPHRDPSRVLLLCPQNSVWLGVCAGIGLRLGLEIWLVRLLAIVLGLITGPLAILTYLGFYAQMYWSSEDETLPRLNLLRAAGRPAGILLAAIAIRMGGDYAARLIAWGHEEILKRPMPAIGEWGWIAYRNGEFFFWAVAICVPVALLSAMPLANAWDHSLKRVAQAGLALYAMALSFGIASILVGIILDFVNEFGAEAWPFLQGSF